MSLRALTLAGVLSGLVAGLVLLGAAVVLGPEPGVARITDPPAATASASPGGASPGATATPGPASSAAAPGTPTGSDAPSPAASRTVMHIGEPAPVLVVTQVGGGAIDLAQLRGRPVWVMFMSTTCTGCREELVLMNGFWDRYSSTGLVILAIDVKEDEGTVATFARRIPATFPFGLDLDGSAQQEWDVLSLPVHFWIDPAGVIRDAAPGVTGSAGMVHGLQQILFGVTVTP